LTHSSVWPRASERKLAGLFFRGKGLRGGPTPSCWRKQGRLKPSTLRRGGEREMAHNQPHTKADIRGANRNVRFAPHPDERVGQQIVRALVILLCHFRCGEINSGRKPSRHRASIALSRVSCRSGMYQPRTNSTAAASKTPPAISIISHPTP
jgi:hypothetical protein